MNAGKQYKTENKKKTQVIESLNDFIAVCSAIRTARSGTQPVCLPSPRSSSRSKAAVALTPCL